jgi:hypothetical protein
MEKGMKGHDCSITVYMAAAKRAWTFILNLPWFRATSNKLHPNATNAIQYREQIDASCLPYQQIA